MFCPNCGHDCGDFKFCPSCGNKLPEKAATPTVKPVWQAGMPCPHCGGTQLDGNNCSYCGALLVVDMPKEAQEKGNLDIPCGEYKAILSSITLYEKDFLVETEHGLFKKRRIRTQIAYDEITSVIYCQSRDPFDIILFRSKDTQSIPIPEPMNFIRDDIAVSVPRENWIFQHIFYMLKAVAPDVAEFAVVSCDGPKSRAIAEDVEKVLARIDPDRYFEKHAPFRDAAVEDLRERMDVPKNVAQAVIDRIFDERQKERYDADPNAAIRDLNQILEEQRRKKQEQEQQREAFLKEQRMLDRLEDRVDRKNRRN